MEPIVIIILVLMVILSFGIGANDETMATLVGSRVLKTKYVIALAAILAFVGVYFLSDKVGRTIGENLLGPNVEYSVSMLIAIIISTTIWLVVTSLIGVPISTTHSVVGAVFGVAIVWSFQPGNSFLTSLDWSTMGQVVLGWIISPLMGFFGAFLLKYLLDKILAKHMKGLERLEKLERSFGYVLIVVVGWTQVSRGGNDSANALGIMYGLIDSGQLAEGTLITLLTLITGVVLALGIVLIGRIVIKYVGNSLIAMRPSDAISIELATSITLFLATIFGFPISGSHVLIFAVVGAGMVKGERPNKKAFRKMIISWVITFPIAAALSALIYVVTIAIF
ncbi:MAG: inorganic phosphate transporter [Candidatus Heimdallarchaeota archaeon]|nr:inorganic phosphate transporter [Candidatus Heimdallarchaeota archaeon]